MADWQISVDSDLQVFPAESNEIWIKGTIVCTDLNDIDFGLMVGNTSIAGNAVGINNEPYSTDGSIALNCDDDWETSNYHLTAGTNSSFVIHILSDETNGIFEVTWSDGTTEIPFHGNVYGGATFNAIQIYDAQSAFFSDVIVSNAALSFAIPQILTADTSRHIVNNRAYLKAWLKFDESTTKDECGNSWTAYGNPTISTTHAVSGQALQLDGQSYIDLNGSIPLGGQDFCIEGSGYFTSGTALFIKKVTDSERGVNVQLLSLETYNSHVFLSVNRTPWNDSNFYSGIESNVSTNQQVNFKLLYHYEDNTLYFYLNDNLVKTHTYTQQLPISDYNVSVGAKNGNSFFTGSIDELRIYTAETISKIFFDTCRNVSQSLILSVDTRRDVSVWRYENYGTADLLSSSGTTVTNLTTNQAIYQTAFYQPNRAKCFDIPATKEIWIKFDVYFDGTNRWRAYNAANNTYLDGITAQQTSSSTGILSFFTQTNRSVYQAEGVTKKNQRQTYLLHMVSNSSAGIVEAWVDDTFIYRAVGNVNNGNDFADIYLQSDGAGTFFSNVIISNVAVDINEHTKYPLAFNVDLLRNVVEVFPQQFYLDTLRNVTLMFKPDCRRVFLTFDNSPTDDVVGNTWETFGNPTIGTANSVSGNALQLDGQSFIKLSNLELGGQDFYIDGYFYYVSAEHHNLNMTPIFRLDMYNYILMLYAVDGENYKKITFGCFPDRTDITGFAPTRTVSNTDLAGYFIFSYKHESAQIDLYLTINGETLINSSRILNVGIPHSSSSRLYIGGYPVDGVNYGIVGSIDQFRVYDGRYTPPINEPVFDTCRDLIHSTGIDNDTFINVISTVEQNLDAVRTLAHTLTLSPVYNFGDLPDTSNDRRAGLQSFEIQMGEQQLTDSVNFVSVNPVDILEQVKGQYLDYKFNMRVEKIVQRGILRTCNCCSDIDELLFKQLDYVIPENQIRTEYYNGATHQIQGTPTEDSDEISHYALASTHISAIANILGKTPVLQFGDFTSTVNVESGGTTYSDLIKTIFGWSARIPTMLINCYLRDDKLFVIQRGHESNIVDLSNYKSDVVSVNKDIIRTYWGSNLWSETEIKEDFARWGWQPVYAGGQKETVSDNGDTINYTQSNSGKVLVTRTTETVNGQTIIKTFDYDSDDFLILSTEQGDDYKISTSYQYKTFGENRKVLIRETTTVSELNNGVWEVTDSRTTNHDYLYEGGGQVYLTSNSADFSSVDHIGNAVGNKNGNDRITPFQSYQWIDGEKKYIDHLAGTPLYNKTHKTIYGVTLFDSSFPIHGDDKLIEITDAIKWLNRKTQEVINLNVYDFPHVIDFNDRIVWGGNSYFLKSNTALKNDDIVNKQTISAVRWY